MSFRTFWKSKGFKPWFFTTIITVILLIAIICTVTLHPAVYQSINAVSDGERRVLVKGDPSQYMYYTSNYKTKEETLAAANALNEEIVAEGITLLKNEKLTDGSKSLPLKSKKITVFGKSSVNLVLGGSGSNAGSSAEAGAKTIYDSLEAAGIEYNPQMLAFYNDNKRSGNARPAAPSMGSILTGFPVSETPASAYTDSLRNSYSEYRDAALVVISRIGGEGFDLPRTMYWDGKNYTNWNNKQPTVIPGARSANDHYLQLDKNETDMLKEAAEHFDNVIVVINCSTPMELGFLDDPTHYAYQENIKGALWLGNPGKTGVMALGKVLNGEVNPSGRTVDTYPRDFTQNPTWNNFGNDRVANGNRYVTQNADGSLKQRGAYFVEYEEGIYVGYRYYETRGETDGEAWYKNNVVYPFGYGLSYTDFDWEIIDSNYADGEALPENGRIEVKVRVTNTGTVKGKDVVQLYYTAPYLEGKNGKAGIEKAHVVLGDFAKTKMLYPASEASATKPNSQELTLSFDVRDMASYDYSDANGNGFTGYELEAGNYEIKLMKNSHSVAESISFVVDEGYTYRNSENADGETVEVNNLFDDVSGQIKQYLSRSDWEGTFPKPLTDADRIVDEAFISKLNFKTDDTDKEWYSETAPTQSKNTLSYNNTKVKLYELIGKDYDDPKWEELLNQLTVKQMKDLIDVGIYRTANIDNVDKPATIDADGPMGFALFMGSAAVYDTCYYASECVMGATWNTELMHEFGVMIGNEGCIGNLKGDGRPYSGWYAPAVNIHRSQFGGRNFEYYSEDGMLSAKLATEVIKGAKSKGVYTYLKHFALNEQETNRDSSGLVTWANEQAMRELYFKPFEYAVKEGKTTALMSSFNRVGQVWSGGNYALLTKLLRNEWGFKGMVITDFNLSSYMNVDQMIRAGGDLNLSQINTISDASSATAVTAMRKATKNILYTVANSNAMNGMGEGVVYKYARPSWWIALVSCSAAVVAGLGVWGFFVCRKIAKRNKAVK